MDSYANFVYDAALNDGVDPITLDEFNHTPDSHPRDVMTIRRNDRPHAVSTASIIAIINDANDRRIVPKDPLTRDPLSTGTIIRACIYRAFQM